MAASFPGAALDFVQMQRAPVTPAASCEARARLRSAVSSAAGFTTDSGAALVSSPEIVISGTQLAFGRQDSDFKLAFDRLEKELAAKHTRLDRAVLSHLYLTSGTLANRVDALEPARSASPRTILPVEALPSLDAPFGLDVIAVPDAAAPLRQ